MGAKPVRLGRPSNTAKQPSFAVSLGQPLVAGAAHLMGLFFYIVEGDLIVYQMPSPDKSYLFGVFSGCNGQLGNG